MLAYRCLHGLAPAYLADVLHPVTVGLLIYPADVVFAQHRRWPSLFLRHASGQLVIVLSGSCITDMELPSVGSHVVENTNNI